MKKHLLLFVLIIFSGKIIVAQHVQTNSVTHAQFNATEINKKLKEDFNKPHYLNSTTLKKRMDINSYSHSTSAVIKKMEEVKKMNFNKLSHPGSAAKVLDTVYVGLVPHDTLRITGSYIHTGPIFVVNDGVLIIHNAVVNNAGDLVVFGSGRVLADSSAITFPQTYFYQRSVIAVQHGYISFKNCSFSYSGMSHSLVMGDSATIVMNVVHNYDWTTAGLYGSPTINIRGSNLGGEYILSDNGHATFNHVDTLLLWHQFPNLSVVNYAFPNGDTVYNYNFNNTVSGISGINYNVSADSCYQVWWAMMPVNGSDITVSNSTIRAIGAWFQRGDTATVTGLYDDSTYINFVAPLTDRNLHLINCHVQTWSLYVFDSSKININHCTLGEVGTEQHANIQAQHFLLDGSGGYFWATDTSGIISDFSTVYSTVRSEKNGIFVLAYSNMPFNGPTSIGNSLVVSVQNTIALDPVPYDASVAWMENISQPNTVHADSLIPVIGSAWIDHGPSGGWMNFLNYTLSYQLQGSVGWTYIVSDSTTEIRNNLLGKWNTAGLAAGTYILRLVVKSNLLDTVEDFKAVTLLPGITLSIKNQEEDNLILNCYPNPAADQITVASSNAKYPLSSIKIYNVLGEMVYQSMNKLSNVIVDIHDFKKGIYFIETIANEKKFTTKFVKE
jgi:hypothetical protein